MVCPHVRFDEGEVASAATPRRGSLLYKRMIICFVAVLSAMWSAFGVTVTNVRGEQRQGSKLVDIYYDLNSTDGGTYTVDVVLEGDTAA